MNIKRNISIQLNRIAKAFYHPKRTFNRVLTDFFEFNLRRIKINTRLVIAFIVFSVIPILMLGGFSFIKSSNAIESKIETYSVQVVDQVSQSISLQMKKYEAICTELITYSDAVAGVDRYLTVSSSFDKSVTHVERIIPPFVAKFSDNSNIISIFLKIQRRNELLRVLNTDSNNNLLTIEDTVSLDKAASSTSSSGIWLSKKLINGRDSVVYVKHSVPYTINDNVPKYYDFKLSLYTVYDQRFLSSIYRSVDLGKNVDLFVMDSKGMVISSKDLDKIPPNNLYKDESLLSNLTDANNKRVNSFASTLGNSKYLVTFSNIKDTDWYVVSTIPYTYLRSESNSVLWSIIGIAIIILSLSMIFSFLLTMSISMPLKRMLALMDEASMGNLYVNIEDNQSDEIAVVLHKFNSMVENIRNLILRVRISSDSVVQDAEELAAFSKVSQVTSSQTASAVQQISQSATDQVNDTIQCVKHVTSLSEDINRVVDNITHASDITINTKKLSDSTLDSIKSLNIKANETRKVSEDITKNINSLSIEMKEIKKIIKLIVEIVEQTKLLSLNASIEAARAGETGKGFAVVAKNIKSLADKSKRSLTDISNIINSIQAKTDEMVLSVDDADKMINLQLEAVSEVDKSFRTIHHAMDQIIINMDSSKQSLSKALVSKEHALTSIDNIHVLSTNTASATQEVSVSACDQEAGAWQLADLALKLNDMARELNNIVDVFRIND